MERGVGSLLRSAQAAGHLRTRRRANAFRLDSVPVGCASLNAPLNFGPSLAMKLLPRTGCIQVRHSQAPHPGERIDLLGWRVGRRSVPADNRLLGVLTASPDDSLLACKSLLTDISYPSARATSILPIFRNPITHRKQALQSPKQHSPAESISSSFSAISRLRPRRVRVIKRPSISGRPWR